MMTTDDLQYRLSILLPNGRSLYEYFCYLPLEELEMLPQRGPSDQLGDFELTQQALEMRDYILRLRYKGIAFQQKYPPQILEQLSDDALRMILHYCADQDPFWPYEAAMRACLKIIFARTKTKPISLGAEKKMRELYEKWVAQYDNQKAEPD